MEIAISTLIDENHVVRAESAQCKERNRKHTNMQRMRARAHTQTIHAELRANRIAVHNTACVPVEMEATGRYSSG